MILDYNFLRQYVILIIAILILGVFIDVVSTFLAVKVCKNEEPRFSKFLYYSIVLGEKITSVAFNMAKFIPIVILLVIIF